MYLLYRDENQLYSLKQVQVINTLICLFRQVDSYSYYHLIICPGSQLRNNIIFEIAR